MDTLLNKVNAPLKEDLDYSSHYIDVLGSKMHYLDVGQGNPVLFLHGVPTWSYLWRNIIPAFEDHARCIAPDLIGFGKSDKPEIEYRVFDHIRYIEAFIQALNLKNITLVLHGWGSVIGFHYAMKYPENVKGLIFVEAYLRPFDDWTELSLPVQELAHVLNLPDGGYDLVMNENYFVNRVLPASTIRAYTEKELNYYREPFKSPGSCKPIWQFVKDAPVPGGAQDVIDLISDYTHKLKSSPIPKLMVYAVPGFITSMSTVRWAVENLPNISAIDMGDALHYVPEGNPLSLRQAMRDWFLQQILVK